MSEKLTQDERERVNTLMEAAQDDLEGVLFGLVGELAAMTAEKELAERQVNLLAGTLESDINSYPCGSMSWSADQWAAWSREQAAKGVTP